MLQGRASTRSRRTRGIYTLLIGIGIVVLTFTGFPFGSEGGSPQKVHAASPAIGINLHGPCDWCGDFLFADAMKSARRWGSVNAPWDFNVGIDSNGWPTSDAGVVVITPPKSPQYPNGLNIAGTYKLIFNGQAANIFGVASSVTVNNKSYNSSTNTTTANLVVGTNSQLILGFTGTKRNSWDSTNTGITNVKVMIPTTLNGNTPHSSSATFSNQAKTMLSKFSVIRFMDATRTNGNQQVSWWSDRRYPNYASQSSDNIKGGLAWEYVIQLSNETGKDAYINIPAKADVSYVNQLAKLFKFGSDANGGVYDSAQSNPYHKPLNSNLKLYIEYSNELWNFAYGFSQSQWNYDAAQAEIAAGWSPLNFDGETNTYYLGWRRVAKRIKEISDQFRTVFGNAAMPPNADARIRPVFEWQYGNAQETARQGLRLLNNFYNNADGQQHVSNPHPVNYYLWGGGGAGYSNVKNPNASSIDGMYNSGLDDGVVSGTVKTDVNFTNAFSLKHIAYEGGFSIGGDNPSALQKQANLDNRAKNMQITAHNKYLQSGGTLLIYFNSTAENYGLAQPSVYQLNTPKMQAINALNV